MVSTKERKTSLLLTYSEMGFVQKLLHMEHHYITEKENHARLSFGRKLSDITLPGTELNGVDLHLTPLEISFLQKLTRTSYSFLTLPEREARQELRAKIRAAWDRVQDDQLRAGTQAPAGD